MVLVANYYEPGPATQWGEISYRIAVHSSCKEAEDLGKWHVTDNLNEGNEAVC